MRNILTIDTTKTPYDLNYCNEGNSTNEIELKIIVSELVNPYLEITKQDSSIENTDVLEITNNHLAYDISFDTYNTAGTFSIRVLSDDYESDYIDFTISETLTESDDVIVKLKDNVFLIKKMSTSKYSEIFNLIYPIGSIYMSLNSTDPSILFGGTWEQIGGRFLVGAGSPNADNTELAFGTLNNAGYWLAPGSYGGQYTHKLTTDEMPSHRHEGIKWFGEQNISLNSTGAYGGYGLTGWSQQIPESYSPLYTNYTGGGAVHNNMPPYLAVYMWQRIS